MDLFASAHAALSDSDSEQERVGGSIAAAYLVSDVCRSTGVTGYSLRASPARIEAALRLAKRRLFHGLWHEWTADDQARLERTVIPLCRRHSPWRSVGELAKFIFLLFRTVRRNRVNWTDEYARQYVRSLGPVWAPTGIRTPGSHRASAPLF